VALATLAPVTMTAATRDDPPPDDDTALWSGRRASRLMTIIRLFLVMAAAAMLPLGLPAPARADTGPAPAGPDTVTVGAFINDLQDIDLSSENFTADVYLWMRWKNPDIDPSTTIESMNSEGTQNTTSSTTGGLEGEPIHQAPKIMPDGSRYQMLRFQGVFSRKLSLKKYPFDTQVLEMVFEDKRNDSTTIRYVPDTNPIAVNDDGAMSIPGYRLGTPSLQVVAHTYPTNFGDLRADANTPYSRIIVELPVARDVLPYLVKIVLPILIVILITALIYLLPARLEEARAGIGVTAMLTIAALQWTADSSLPSVEYLTLLDLVYLISMLYILAAMAYTVAASRRNRPATAAARSVATARKAGIASLVIYLAVLAIAVAYYLHQQYNVLNQYL
jgi:hypothetical protein